MRRNLTAAVVVVVLLGLGFGLAWWVKPAASIPAADQPGPTLTLPPAGTGTGTSAAAGTTGTPVPSVPYPTGEPYSKTSAAQRRWTHVAVGFARQFSPVGKRTAAQWRASLAPYVTPALLTELGTVDVRNVPEGRFSSAEATDWGEDQVTVQLDYRAGDAGFALTLSLTATTTDRATWKVDRYDRQELG